LAKSNLILDLAKVIIAAAWADGEVSHDEINSLKDLLFHLPNMEARDWASLDIYIDSPVDADERARLVDNLLSSMAKRAHRDLALSALNELIHADGEVPEAEERVAEEIRSAIEQADVGILGGMGRLIKGPIQRRSAAAADREEYLEDFIKNRVYYGLRRRLEELGETPELSEAELRKLSLAGGLMARVAHVDREVTPGENEAMVKALQENWGCTKEEATIVTEVAVAAVAADLDFYRMAREFFTCTTEEERVNFLDVLFAVAVGDGAVSNIENEGIRRIAQNLKLTHKQFITAKVKIPKSKRSS
jgi:uncharacterized tellurite resistance protein B-like protein